MFGIAARTCCSAERHGVNVLHLQYYLRKSIPNSHVRPSLETLLSSLVHLIERTFLPEASFYSNSTSRSFPAIISFFIVLNTNDENVIESRV